MLQHLHKKTCQQLINYPTLPARVEALLSRVDDIQSGREDRPDDGRSKNSIVSVSDTKGPVRNKARMLFREQKQKAIVKTCGMGLTNGEGIKNCLKNRSGRIWSSSPGGEGNAVGLTSGVAISTNSALNLVARANRTKFRVNRSSVVFKKTTARG